ncbi:cholesterol 7-desaturase nvd-like [Zerene cesonia]|uniref:cholesterol 7-desaturase nvd-like n=1 Tax=Zerene cesonia TaxID=33412 RepID=UPI0018E59F56|nr:cholesterol 7-desaturase nvd-like [Zerene cesonia]
MEEYSSIGFDHIPHAKGADRSLHIKWSQRNRPLGEKIPPPYPNGWYALAESVDLKIGGVASIDALGQNFCIYRGEDGAARVVDAYCPHLGANFGAGGAVRGNCIECPFHMWRFGENGECTYIPDTKTIPKVSLKTWHTMEVDGAVWVWYDAEGRAPLWTVPPIPGIDAWGYRGRNEFVVSTHIRDIPENAADASHLHTVHGLSFMTDLGKRYPMLNKFVGYHSWKSHWSRSEEWHIAQLFIEQKFFVMKLNIFPLNVSVDQIGPAHVRLTFNSIIGPMVVVQTVTPLGPMLQRVVHRVYSPTWNAILVSPVALVEALQFERDVVIWNNKKHVSAPPYVKADKSIRAFRDWFAQFYSAASVSMRDATARPLDW